MYKQKILKGLLYFILILIGTLLLAAIFAPGTKIIERSVEINAPQAAVFNQIAHFENWENWDPWFKLDTTQNRSYTGKWGDKEYGYSWSSKNDNVGKGSIMALGFNEQDRMDYHLSFDDGGGGNEADGYFTLNELDGVTRVTWVLVSKRSYPMKIFNYFLEKFIAPDFEKGLANLKAYAESNPNATNEVGNNVEIVSEHGVNYAVVKSENVSFNALDSFFRVSYQPIYDYLRDNGLQPKGAARALYYVWDEANSSRSVAAAVPISEIVSEEIENVQLAIGGAEVSANSITYLQKGGYNQLEFNHNTLRDWVDGNGKKIVYPIMEEYRIGPRDTQDSLKYQTRIIYYFK